MKRLCCFIVFFAFVFVWLTGSLFASNAFLSENSKNTFAQKENKQDVSPVGKTEGKGNVSDSKEDDFFEKEMSFVPDSKSEEDSDKPWLTEGGQSLHDKQLDDKLRKRLALTFFALVVVIVLAYFFIKFLSSGKVDLSLLGGISPKSKIKILDRQMLGPNRGLLIVRVGTKTMLVGQCEHNISFISDVELPEEDNKEASQKKETVDKFELFPEVK